jgi:ATP-dependent RNA helicase HelY
VREALAGTTRIWAELADDEADQGLPRTREPQLGFVWAAYRWTQRDGLDRVLTSAADVGVELSAGDFVRWCKQLLDLLEQIASAPSPSGVEAPVAERARAAARTIRRGVVAQGMFP